MRMDSNHRVLAGSCFTGSRNQPLCHAPGIFGSGGPNRTADLGGMNPVDYHFPTPHNCTSAVPKRERPVGPGVSLHGTGSRPRTSRAPTPWEVRPGVPGYTRSGAKRSQVRFTRTKNKKGPEPRGVRASGDRVERDAPMRLPRPDRANNRVRFRTATSLRRRTGTILLWRRTGARRRSHGCGVEARWRSGAYP